MADNSVNPLLVWAAAELLGICFVLGADYGATYLPANGWWFLATVLGAAVILAGMAYWTMEIIDDANEQTQYA